MSRSRHRQNALRLGHGTEASRHRLTAGLLSPSLVHALIHTTSAGGSAHSPRRRCAEPSRAAHWFTPSRLGSIMAKMRLSENSAAATVFNNLAREKAAAGLSKRGTEARAATAAPDLPRWPSGLHRSDPSNGRYRTTGMPYPRVAFAIGADVLEAPRSPFDRSG